MSDFYVSMQCITKVSIDTQCTNNTHRRSKMIDMTVSWVNAFLKQLVIRDLRQNVLKNVCIIYLHQITVKFIKI